MGGELRSWRKLFLEFISFDSPRAVVLNFSLFILVLALLPTENLSYLPIRSVYETVFHVTPYSSGMLRSLSRLLHGDLQGSLEFNRLGVAVLAVMAVLVLQNIWKIRHSGH